MRKQNRNKKIQTGFTLVELLVVIAILGLIASIVLVALNGARDKAKSATAVSNQRQLQKAVELYSLDMGFYPPDVGRGWDPGLFKRLPYNLDLGNDCDINPSDCPICNTCPSDWVNQVKAKWKGPYVQWPSLAPWGGKYDFNNWNATTTRYGCDVPPGIYIGTQRNYDESNPLPQKEEIWMLSQGLDGDNCLNGESEMSLVKY